MTAATSRVAELEGALSTAKALSEELGSLLLSFDARMGRLHESIMPVQSRSAALARASANVAIALEASERQLALLEIPRLLAPRLSGPVPDDIHAYLQDVEKLVAAAGEYEESAEESAGAAGALEEATRLLEQVCARCEKKLEEVLKRHGRDDRRVEAGAEPPASPLPFPVDDEALPLLQPLIEQLEALSYSSYPAALSRVRAAALAEVLGRLGLERVRGGAVLGKDGRTSLPADALTERVLLWARLLRWLVALVSAEAPLWERLLPTPALASAVLFDIARAPLDSLLGFAEALARDECGADKLFLLLELQGGLAAALPRLPPSLSSSGGGREAVRRAQRLRDAVEGRMRESFADLEGSVGRGERRGAGPDGAIHPTTASLMHSLRRLFDSPQLFDLLCGTEPLSEEELAALGPPPPPPPPQEGKKRRAAAAAAAAHAEAMAEWMASRCSEEALGEVGDAALACIVALLGQLDALSRPLLASRTPGLAPLFLMNNLHAVCQGVRRSPLLLRSLGEEWVAQQESVLSTHADGVLNATWGACAAELVSLEGLGGSSDRERERVKEKFRIFNDTFEAAVASLPHWTVPSLPLREELRRRLGEVVVEPYARFYAACADCGFTKNREKYVRFQPEGVESAFASFFEGLA